MDSDKVVIFIGTIILVIAMPFLMFWFGYFDGWLFKLLVGNQLTDCLNKTFNVTYFTPDILPKVGGALGFIGGFFKVNSSRK